MKLTTPAFYPRHSHNLKPLPAGFFHGGIPILCLFHIRVITGYHRLSMADYNRRAEHLVRMNQVGLIAEITLN